MKVPKLGKMYINDSLSFLTGVLSNHCNLSPSTAPPPLSIYMIIIISNQLIHIDLLLNFHQLLLTWKKARVSGMDFFFFMFQHSFSLHSSIILLIWKNIGTTAKKSACHCKRGKRHKCYLQVGKILWRRKW